VNDAPSKDRQWRPPFWLTVVATVALAVVPVIVDLWTADETRVFGFLVADFFYYITVARNFVEHGLLSFDQMSQTNGFHPLWQLMLIVLQRIASNSDWSDIFLFRTIIVVNLVLIGVGLTGIAMAWREAEGRLPALFPLLSPGVFAVLTIGFYDPSTDYGSFQTEEGQRPVVGTIWHYANGMETSLLIASFGLLLWFHSRHLVPKKWMHGAIAGGLGAMVTLARLDHIFFPGALLLSWLAVGVMSRDWKAVRVVAVAGAVMGTVVGAYLLFNKGYTDAWLPLSGTVKSTYPFVANGGISHLLKVLRFRKSTPIHMIYRQAQIFVPLVFSAGWVLWCFALRLEKNAIRLVWRDTRRPIDGLLCALVPAIVALASYNFLFVPPYDQGTWYFPLSIIFVSLASIRWMDLLLQKWSNRWAEVVTLAATTLFGAWFYFPSTHHVDFHRDVAEFYLEEAPQLTEFYKERGLQPSFIEYYDGLLAASTDFPTFSGFGLVVDKEAARAKKRNELFKVAFERGYDRIQSFYLDAAKLSTAPNNKELKRILGRWIDESQLKEMDLRVEYISKSGKYYVVKVTRKMQEPRKRKNQRRGKGALRKKNRGSKKKPRARKKEQG
jgi:hypothetical protein